MYETKLSIRPRERLHAAMELLSGADTVADIGCDHGRLCCALIQNALVKRCIACDVSEPSLNKARRLIEQTGMGERVETRLGDGLKPLSVGEADALALLGMGGTLMARILEADKDVFCSAKRIVLQPMRAPDDIRRWLYENSCHIIEDRVVQEGGRYYQIFSATPPQAEHQTIPHGWQTGLWMLGYTAFSRRTKDFDVLARRMLEQIERKRRTERSPVLDARAMQLDAILRQWEESE